MLFSDVDCSSAVSVVCLGCTGVQRSAQALQALLSIGQDYARTGQLDPPEVILRKLFERLGATYIKLGQFVASSPSLFPPNYVTEFQKCLDQTEPVSYDKIRKTIEAELTVPIDQVCITLGNIHASPVCHRTTCYLHCILFLTICPYRLHRVPT